MNDLFLDERQAKDYEESPKGPTVYFTVTNDTNSLTELSGNENNKRSKQANKKHCTPLFSEEKHT